MHMNKYDFRSVYTVVLLSVLPNLLAMINITIFGYKIHMFQYLVFVAAAAYGPYAGALSGGVGSLYTSILLGNPYIIIGNIILGYFTGLFFRKGMHLIKAAIIAFAVQLPWLWITDAYLIGMPIAAVKKIVLTLLISNVVWAACANHSYRYLKWK